MSHPQVAKKLGIDPYVVRTRALLINEGIDTHNAEGKRRRTAMIERYKRLGFPVDWGFSLGALPVHPATPPCHRPPSGRRAWSNIGYVWVPTELAEPGNVLAIESERGHLTRMTAPIPFVDPKKEVPAASLRS